MSFSLHIETTGSRSSLQKPETDSRHLCAERRPPSNQLSGGLFPGGSTSPQFRRRLSCYDASSVIHFRSSFCLVPARLIPAFPSTLTTATLNRSSSEWFGAWRWSPTPKGLPSSFAELAHHESRTAFCFSFFLMLLRHTADTTRSQTTSSRRPMPATCGCVVPQPRCIHVPQSSCKPSHWTSLPRGFSSLKQGDCCLIAITQWRSDA